MRKYIYLIVLLILSTLLFSQTKANVKMLNGDTIPCEIETERLDLVTDYGELSFGTEFIKTIQFPEPGKGNTVLNTIFGETFRGFITNDIIELNVYGSQMQIRKAKINNIEFLKENRQATDYTIMISLRNGDAFYATPADSIINIQTSYGEVKLPFENMAAISFEGFGNVLTRIEMKDGGILQGIIKDDYIPVNLLSEIELEIVPDLMKEINFVDPVEKTTVSNAKPVESKQPLLKTSIESEFNHKKSEMVLVKSGTFKMGNTRNDSEGSNDEKPTHTVKITYDFYIGKYELTFAEYDIFQMETISNKPDDEGWGRGKRPVVNVSWWDAILYCNWLSEKEGLAVAYDKKGNLLDINGIFTTDISRVEGYRLPTEAEWEYAARGGHKRIEDFKYSGSNSIVNVAWYSDNSSAFGTQPVGLKGPNSLGIYDMSGNVMEWCHDFYKVYSEDSKINPMVSSLSGYKILRGGGWSTSDPYCRISNRESISADNSNNFTGFRIVKTKMNF